MFFAKSRLVYISILLCAMNISLAEADPKYWEDNSWLVTVGGYWADSSTTVRVDATDGSVGTEINGEDDLSWNNREFSPFIILNYRFNPNHSLLVSYWSIRRNGLKDITFDLDIGDETYTGGTTIDSEFITDIYRLTYGYTLYNSERSNIAFIVGLHITNLKFNLRAVGGIGTTVQTAADAVAPLPAFGFSGSYKMNNEWYVSGWLQGFALEYDNYDGKMLNATLYVTYKPFKHVSFNAGAAVFDMNLTATDEDARGEFDYKYVGPVVSVSTAF